MSEIDHDDLPGDYNSIEGIKERAAALGNPIAVTLVERAEDRLYYDEDVGGYRIETPDSDDPNDVEMLFHLGILTGAALEREYPAPDEDT